MSESTVNIIELLEAFQAGDANAGERLFSALHDSLHDIAYFLKRRDFGPVSLSTGDLVNEAVVRLLQSDISAQDKAHLLALCARVMRNALVDAARRRNADKRRKITVTLNGQEVAEDGQSVNVQKLETALIRLKAIAPDRAEIVILRYYGGMTLEEIGAVLGVSESTVKRSWRASRAWLREALEDE